MVQSYKFAIARVSSGAPRDERLNVGIVVLSETGIETRLSRRLQKLRAISAALSSETVVSAMDGLRIFDANLIQVGIMDIEARFQALRDFSPFQMSDLGEFFCHSTNSYQNTLDRLLSTLIEPEPAVFQIKPKRTRLVTAVKSSFRHNGVLARRNEDLSSHRLVPNVRIDEGLAADFVLKNGFMHIFETVDASHEDTTIRKVVSEVAISALVLERARMAFGENNTRSTIIYDASSQVESAAMPSLYAAEHQGADLINWSSVSDRDRLLDKVYGLAIPFDKGGAANKFYHASLQPKLKLN